MKFCYVDESGTGDEPYGVMAGIIVDALRMKPTKQDWDDLLKGLSKIANREIKELHTREFYSGNGPWRGINGDMRANIIEVILDWIAKRKHSIIYTVVEKKKWYSDFSTDSRHADIKTLWRFLGLHLVLGIQKYHKGNKNNKGNTILVFDNEEREMKRFTDLIQAPPKWSSTYYGLEDETDPLSQVVDVPYFADSVDVPLLQVADFVAFFLRKHAELENGVIERYDGERLKVRSWINMALKRRIPLSAIFPKRGRCSCSEMFFNYAPSCLRDS